MNDHPIAYFCAEYALSDTLPLYAGGLGILAGDMVREAATQQLPFVAIGLLYHNGYASKQTASLNPDRTELKPVLNGKNERLIITVPLRDKSISLKAWVFTLGTVAVYLLDTDVQTNTGAQRHITDHLYAADKEVRFQQEIILGIGGLRLLKALHVAPRVYHLNEGHSALLSLELTRLEMQKQQRSFSQALEKTKQQIVFTNHTLVPAGNDIYETELVVTQLAGFAKEINVPINDIIALGKVSEENIFSMALLALRMTKKVNAVSKIHSEKAITLWPEYPMIPITNGIHTKTWDCIENNVMIWESHQENKRALLSAITHETGMRWNENDLLIGWARRIVDYKRPLALFEHIQHLQALATNKERPLRIVFSGIAHASDAHGQAIIETIKQLAANELKGTLVYLPDYTMTLAKMLVAGCDVWLNTPIVGSEACGTSGMKAALNGCLPCSTNDGWVAEADLANVGWLLNNEKVSDSIIATLSNDIIPTYYTRDTHNIPQQWVTMMHNARSLIMKNFTATTMLKKYNERLYC
jgi:glucan phosphorylase